MRGRRLTRDEVVAGNVRLAVADIANWLRDEHDDPEAFIAFIPKGEDRLGEDGEWRPADRDYIRICTGSAEAQFYIPWDSVDLLNPIGACDEVAYYYNYKD
jgi:hypothetical protein